MKIAYFYGPEDVRIEETAVPEPGYGEVVIKNKVALTCGTDLKTYLRGHPLWIPPAVFGHEASGVVYKVGEGVEAVGAVEALLVFPVAALDFAVVSGRVGADQFVAYAQGSGGGFKERVGFAI